jgi:hypothetical protein
MLPIAPGQTLTSLTRNGSPVSSTVGTVKGVQYAFVPAVAGSYQVTFAADTTPPTVTAVSPVNNATNVATTTAVTVTFNEAVAPVTVTTSTFQLQDPGNNLIAATVTYDAATQTATLTPSAALLPNTAYTATVKGGLVDPRVKDLAGNPLATDVAWSFTTGSGLTYTIWPATATPDRADSDPNAVTLGVKFRSDVAGTITGIRFYKMPTTTGTHVGSLWTITGTLLASVTFANETASGWQQMNFTSPVAITANTTYVASYHTPVGRYAVNSNYFATAGVDNPPLHAPSTTAGGGNGVYAYGPSSSFPNLTYTAENYWVDVVFQP